MQKGKKVPIVSVIVPVYRSEPYIEQCIDSILAQSFQDFELILVDDGSPDGCGGILDRYAVQDRRIRVIHQENAGQSAARNAGLGKATGKYVYIPDSDDVLHLSLLERVIPRFDEGFDLIAFGFETIPPGEWVDTQHKHTSSKERTFVLNTKEERYAFLTGPFRRRVIRWEPWNRIFRRDIIEKWNVRFPKNRGVYPEDMFFNYCYIAHTAKILLLPEKLYLYRRNVEGSVSDRSTRDLMISTSHLLTEELYAYYAESEDCRYFEEHFLPVYYLLHKGAVRRLRRYQWRNGLDMQQARGILREHIGDCHVFQEKMRQAYNDPVVRESYRKDAGALLQITDRLYTGELLQIPVSGIAGRIRRSMLYVLCRVSGETHLNKRKNRRKDRE